MTVGELYGKLEELYPRSLSAAWDNDGRMVLPDENREVRRVLCCLDCDAGAAAEALRLRADVILTHHPLIFGGIDNVTTDSVTGKLLQQMIRADISCYACHTNLDLTDEFGNLAIAEALGATDAVHLDGTVCGIVYDSPEGETVKSLAKRAADGLHASGIITVNNPDNKAGKVFVQGGSFDEESIPAIVEAGCNTVISGEIKHHLTVALEELSINSIIAGHSATEQIYLPKIAKMLEEEFPKIKFIVNNNNESASVL
jgi:dinuclear metal center YbgI/SA1388 family protein